MAEGCSVDAILDLLRCRVAKKFLFKDRNDDLTDRLQLRKMSGYQINRFIDLIFLLIENQISVREALKIVVSKNNAYDT